MVWINFDFFSHFFNILTTTFKIEDVGFVFGWWAYTLITCFKNHNGVTPMFMPGGGGESFFFNRLTDDNIRSTINTCLTNLSSSNANAGFFFTIYCETNDNENI